MIAATPVIELAESKKEVNEFLPANLLYGRDVPSNKCTLVLGGKVTVIAGMDNFKSDISSWSVLAPGALTEALYSPDFSAYVSSGPCRCLQFTREIFEAAVSASGLESLASDPLSSKTSKVVYGSNGSGEEKREEEPPANLLATRTAPSSMGSPKIVKIRSDLPTAQTEGLVKHRGKLLEKLLKDNSTHNSVRADSLISGEEGSESEGST